MPDEHGYFTDAERATHTVPCDKCGGPTRLNWVRIAANASGGWTLGTITCLTLEREHKH